MPTFIKIIEIANRIYDKYAPAIESVPIDEGITYLTPWRLNDPHVHNAPENNIENQKGTLLIFGSCADSVP
jgi:hypothetical protein